MCDDKNVTNINQRKAVSGSSTVV